MKKIPNIYKPNIDKEINNNEKAYYSYAKEDIVRGKAFDEDPIDTINRLMSNGAYIFNKKLIIKTLNNTYHTRIAGRVGKKLVTLDGDTLDIENIIKIYEE